MKFSVSPILLEEGYEQKIDSCSWLRSVAPCRNVTQRASSDFETRWPSPTNKRPHTTGSPGRWALGLKISNAGSCNVRPRGGVNKYRIPGVALSTPKMYLC